MLIEQCVVLFVRSSRASEQSTAQSRAARLGRTDVRVAARRTVRRRPQARDRLCDARAHGVQRPNRVGAGDAQSGRHWITTADLSSDGAGRANASGMVVVHTRSGVGGEAVTPGAMLLESAPVL